VDECFCVIRTPEVSKQVGADRGCIIGGCFGVVILEDCQMEWH
jgi:hypothetical protein